MLSVHDTEVDKKLMDLLLKPTFKTDVVGTLTNAAQSSMRSVRKEGLWCLANLVASDRFVRLDGDRMGKAIDVLESTISNSEEGLDVKKEVRGRAARIVSLDLANLFKRNIFH